MYAERHSWPLRRTTVELWREKAPAADGVATVDQFHRTLHLEGDLTEEQRLRLLQIAEKCAVARHCGHAAVVDARLADVLPDDDGRFGQSAARS